MKTIKTHLFYPFLDCRFNWAPLLGAGEIGSCLGLVDNPKGAAAKDPLRVVGE